MHKPREVSNVYSVMRSNLIALTTFSWSKTALSLFYMSWTSWPSIKHRDSYHWFPLKPCGMLCVSARKMCIYALTISSSMTQESSSWRAFFSPMQGSWRSRQIQYESSRHALCLLWGCVTPPFYELLKSEKITLQTLQAKRRGKSLSIRAASLYVEMAWSSRYLYTDRSPCFPFHRKSQLQTGINVPSLQS